MDSNLEKSPKIKLWKKNIEKLLFKTNICGICLSENEDLDNLDTIYHIELSKKERTLEEIIKVTFGYQVLSLLPTKHICGICVTTILQSYQVVNKIRSNGVILQKYIQVLTQQATFSSGTELPIEKQLLLTIDNVNNLNVPTTVTVSEKGNENAVTQIFLCEVNDVNTSELEFNVENYHLKYECPYCGKQFHDFTLFKDHYNLHNEAYYRCYKCAKRFKYFTDFVKHRKTLHSDDLTICNVCEIILLRPESTEHEIEHTEELHCSTCQLDFLSRSDLEMHKSEYHSYSCAYITCQKCLKTFSNILKFEHHRCPYKCSECKDDCVHIHYLASYKKQHMDGATTFNCPNCDFKYSMKSQIICHVNQVHLNHLPYLCDLCGKNFASHPQLMLHINKKHADVSQVFKDHCIERAVPIVSSVLSERPYECDKCGFCFNSEKAYTIHRRKHLTEETKCHICKKSFCNIGQLNIHRKKEHPNEFANRNIIYRCTMCPLDFKLRSNLLKHISTHPKGTCHNCRECKQSFFSKKAYISHVAKHKVVYDKPCPICFKKYTKHTISRHMRLHNIENSKIFKCDVCAEEFSSEKSLIKHSNKHSEQRQCPHCELYVNSVLYSKHVSTHMHTEKQIKSCSECNYTTKFAVCLEAHINRHHLEVRPYKCDICDKTFYSDYTLRGHMATHKNERPEHYCDVCGKKFISKKALIFHTRLHTGEQPYPCNYCKLSFLSSSRRRQHMIRKHFEPQFECQICLKKLYTQSDLRRHVGDCHGGAAKRKKPKKVPNEDDSEK